MNQASLSFVLFCFFFASLYGHLSPFVYCYLDSLQPMRLLFLFLRIGKYNILFGCRLFVVMLLPNSSLFWPHPLASGPMNDSLACIYLCLCVWNTQHACPFTWTRNRICWSSALSGTFLSYVRECVPFMLFSRNDDDRVAVQPRNERLQKEEKIFQFRSSLLVYPIFKIAYMHLFRMHWCLRWGSKTCMQFTISFYKMIKHSPDAKNNAQVVLDVEDAIELREQRFCFSAYYALDVCFESRVGNDHITMVVLWYMNCSLRCKHTYTHTCSDEHPSKWLMVNIKHKKQNRSG